MKFNPFILLLLWLLPVLSIRAADVESYYGRPKVGIGVLDIVNDKILFSDTSAPAGQKFKTISPYNLGVAIGAGGGGGFDATAVDAVTWSDGANATNTWTFNVSGTDPSIIFGNGSITMNAAVSVTSLNATDATVGNILLSEGTAPATPAASKVAFYAKVDGLIYGKDDAGTETALSNPALGAGVATALSATANAPGGVVTAGQAVDVFVIAISDETTALTTGTAKVTFRAPYAFTITAVRASLTTVSSSGTPTFDINEAGTTCLSTKLTVDASEKTSTTAATAAVISDTAIADDAEVTIDIDTAGTSATGAKITIVHTH